MSGPPNPAGGPPNPAARGHGAAFTVRVPASAANLGPGFDALGLALGLHDEVDVEVVRSGVTVEVAGAGAGRLPLDGRHLVVRAIRATLDALGAEVPGLALRCRNRIPHSRGLGSSAAAAVAGVAAGYALAGVALEGTERAGGALQLVAGFEGHADNAAASLLGGLTIAWQRDDGTFDAACIDPHPDLAPVVLVPDVESRTATTRGLLPAQVPHRDAAFNAARVALLLHALTALPSRELLLAGTADRLHQPYRSDAYPATSALVAALRAHGVAATVSGAGPTVLALTCGEPLPAAVDLTGFDVRPLCIERSGVRVVPAVR